MNAGLATVREDSRADARWSIRLHKVCFHYSQQRSVIANLDLVVGSHSRVSIMGPSGSGKTTLLKILAGILAPTRGLRSVSGPRPRVGMLPQDDPFLPWRTVWRNLLLVKEPEGTSQDLETILASVGLAADVYRERLPMQLSGGERRRLGLAMVLASRPQLLLLDEAGSSLDETIRFSVVDEVLRTTRRLSAGVVAITHDVEEALLLGDHLMIFDPGGISTQVVNLPPDRTSSTRFTPEFQELRADVVRRLAR